MTYTACGPEAEARVAEDLHAIVAAVRDEAGSEDLGAVLLLGGYARGEGTVVRAPSGALRGFNDYDLLLVFRRSPPVPDRFTALAKDLARRLEIDFVDLGLAGPEDLRGAPPTLFWYELGEAHQVLWQAADMKLHLPRFRASDLEEAEGSRLLLNRGMALLWAALRLGDAETASPAAAETDRRFAVIASHKAILAAGDAALLASGDYSIHQEERLQRLRRDADLPAWAPRGFLDAYARAVAFRRRPEFPSPAESLELWAEACIHHEAGFARAEASRLHAAWTAWAGHRRLVLSRARRGALAGPRKAARALRRVLRRETWMEREELLFAEFPSLLYGSPDRFGKDAAVRGRAAALIHTWHP